MNNRKSHWQNIYREKSPIDLSWYQKEPTLSLDMIQRCDINRDDAIIDVGGGSSLLVNYLYSEGYRNLSVLDISAIALSRSRKRLGGLAKHIDWIEADITATSLPCHYSLWHDRAVFHYLTSKSDRKQYIRILMQTLKPKGHLIIAAFAIGGPHQCSGLEVVQYNAEKLLSELGKDFELMEEVNELHFTPACRGQEFVYFRFKKFG